MILGQLVESDDVRTADLLESTNNHLQVKGDVFWITENVMRVHLRILVANFVAISIPQCEVHV